MRYFGSDHFAGRINFVDAFNVLVGYDMIADCCEKFEWFVTDVAHFNDGHEYWEARTRAGVNEFGEPKSNVNEISGWDEYRFDVSWCNVIENMDIRPYYDSDEESMSVAMFRMVAEGRRDLYLVFSNCHNGFYSHGFDMKDESGRILHEGSL